MKFVNGIVVSKGNVCINLPTYDPSNKASFITEIKSTN